MATPGAQAVWAMTGWVLTTFDHQTAGFDLSTNLPGSTSVFVTTRSATKAAAWNGLNAQSSVDVCGPPATCASNITDASYFQSTIKALPSASTPVAHVEDYSGKESSPVWSKRYHRVYFTSPDGKNADLTDVLPWMKVPPGMVFVLKEMWPQDTPVAGASETLVEGYPISSAKGAWDATPHDYAIDRYEVSLANSASGTTAAFPNDWNGILVSTPTTPVANRNWYAFKQGCLNRTWHADANDYPSFTASADLPTIHRSTTVTPNPRRKYHIATGVEWMVASYGTPDMGGAGFCNLDDRGSPSSPGDVGANSTEFCVSHVGARNMIGNVLENCDDWVRRGTRGSILRWNGTLAEHSAGAAEVLVKYDTQTDGSWDFRLAARVESTQNITIMDDDFWSAHEDAGDTEGGEGGGLGNISLRGGRWPAWVPGGRFMLDFKQSTTAVHSDVGGRCVLVAPQPVPLLARLANDSDANAAKLYWTLLDTEDTTVVRIGHAASRADLDAWDGTNTPPNVTITSHAINDTNAQGFGGDCTSSYVPGSPVGAAASRVIASGGKYVSPGEGEKPVLYSHKYCHQSFTGTRYYKICATNPALPQVLDQYPEAQRTTCSTVVATQKSVAPPVLQTFASGSLLQNDSDGAYARFYWTESGGSAVVRKLVVGVDVEEVLRWNGDSDPFNGFDPVTRSGVVVLDLSTGSYGSLGAMVEVRDPNQGAVSTCATAHFTPPGTWGPYAPAARADGTLSAGATHYTCVRLDQQGLGLPKMGKRFFKLAVANADGAGTPMGGWTFSELHGAGYVPTGMVYVTREEWQMLKGTLDDYSSWRVCVRQTAGRRELTNPSAIMNVGSMYGAGVGCVYDFAMDKYETYDAGGTWSTANFGPTPAVAVSNNTSLSDASATSPATTNTNTTTAIVRSAQGQNAATGHNWFGFKTACGRRNAELQTDGFVVAGSQPVNRVRLPNGLEWVLAAFGTPDSGNNNTTCWVKNNNTGVIGTGSGEAALAGTGGMAACVSQFGTFDQIGNVEEFTDDVTVGGARDVTDRWARMVGTSQALTLNSPAVPTLILTGTTNSAVNGWDATTGFPSSWVATGEQYYWYPAVLTSGPPQGGSGGSNWVATRGGDWLAGEAAGRLTLRLTTSPADATQSRMGARCMVLPR